ncbi:O-GlcNAc transferase [Bryobacterales bacterium F-183]|nr:O-GlcNAc transferase [Bryobacterales bacterium F-183]
MRLVFSIVAMFAVVWGWSIFGPFHFDDHSMLRDPRITGSSGWWQVWMPLQTRPLTQFSFWLNYGLSGANPLPFHLVNLLLHALNTWLVWRVAGRLIQTTPQAVWIATLLFALHPLQSEPVNYVFARSTLLMSTFCLLTVWYWIGARYWASFACFVLALLAKEECVTLPFALLLLDWCRGGVLQMRPQGVAALSMLMAAGAAGVRAVIATQATPGAGAGFSAGITPLEYFTAQGVVIWRYLRLAVVPWGFTVDTEVAMPEVWVSALGWGAIAAVCVVAWRKRWYWLLIAFVLLIPSSSIFPAEDLAADRRMYLPLFALCLFAARVPKTAGIVMLAVFGAVSVYRTAFVWSSERALWQEAVEQSPGKVRARIQLARALPVAEAVPVLDQAAQFAPQDPDVPNELGLILLRNGRAAEALSAFGRALALEPGSALILNNRGVALQQLGQNKAAQADFLRALQKDPCLADARENFRLAGGDPATAALPAESPRGCPSNPRSARAE